MEVEVTLINVNVNVNNSAYVLCVKLALLNLCVTLAAMRLATTTPLTAREKTPLRKEKHRLNRYICRRQHYD